MTRLLYLILVVLIVLSITGLVLETGHAHLCQREIERLQAEFAKSVQQYPGKVGVKKASSDYRRSSWLLSMPAGKACEIAIVSQNEKDTSPTTIRKFQIPASNVPEVVSLQIRLIPQSMGDATLQIETSRSTKVEMLLPSNSRMMGGIYSNFEQPPTNDLYDAKQLNDQYSRRLGPTQTDEEPRPLVREEILMFCPVVDAVGEETLYGVTLSVEP